VITLLASVFYDYVSSSTISSSARSL